MMENILKKKSKDNTQCLGNHAYSNTVKIKFEYMYSTRIQMCITNSYHVLKMTFGRGKFDKKTLRKCPQ